MTRPGRGRLRAGLRRRVPDPGDDRGSLPLAMLLILVGMALAAVLLPTMIVQDRASVFDGSRTDNLAAAQAGVDVVLGEIRAASTSGTGSVAALPCATSTNPVTGPVNTVGNATYSAYVSYFETDPIANPPPPAGTNTPMVCSPGNGTYDAATRLTIPAFALITSTGTDGAANGASTGRTIRTTYVFQTSNANIPDGQIRIYPSGTSNWCMDAGSTAPAAGALITLQACSGTTPILQQQLFYYRSDLTIQLATSITAGYPNGLCLDTSAGASGPAIGNTVVLSQCLALGSPPFSQQWSFNDAGGFTASLSSTKSDGNFAPNGSYPYGYCMSVGNQAAGQRIVLDDCKNGNTSSPAQAWIPSPTVGDGAAANPPATNFQLVNYQQFGRCLDITSQDPTNNTVLGHFPYIAYPCKQNPFPGAVAWNQKFSFSGTPGTSTAAAIAGTLSTSTGGVTYCVTSPRTEGGYVTLTPCIAGATNLAALLWTQPGNTATTSYTQRYTYVDSSTDATRCLGISAPPAGDSSPWSYITVSTCSSSTALKWNANPNLGAPALQNTLEEQ